MNEGCQYSPSAHNYHSQLRPLHPSIPDYLLQGKKKKSKIKRTSYMGRGDCLCNVEKKTNSNSTKHPHDTLIAILKN